MQSPCNRQCKLDKNKICIGCKRTYQEIIDWRNYTDQERGVIIKRVKTTK